MSKIRLVLLDDSKDLCDAVVQHIAKNYGDLIELAGVAHDGQSGIALIESERPDIALIDVIMPKSDGVEVLEHIKQSKEIKDTICIMLSAGASDFTSNRLLSAGADYFCLKPFDIRSLMKCVLNAYNFKTAKKAANSGEKEISGSQIRLSQTPKTAPPIEDYAARILADIGAGSRLRGYYFLKSSIVKCLSSGEHLDMLTKSLYPSVAKEFGTTGERVERSMRHLLSTVWSRGKPEKYYEIIGEPPPMPMERPAVGAFLRAVVNLYKHQAVDIQLRNENVDF